MQTLSKFLSTAIEAASQASTRLREVLGAPRANRGVTTKRNLADLVTRAVRVTKDLIVALLRELFSSHGVIAENGTSYAGQDYGWIIDPIDGTTNFASGLPLFGVSIALGHDGDQGCRMNQSALLATIIIAVLLIVPAVPAFADVPVDLKVWLFAGDVNLRIPLSELNFPAGGTVPILTLGASQVTVRYGGSALQMATWTDSDWTSPQPMVGARPQPDSSQTKGSMTGDFSLYSVSLALAPEGATQFVFLGYAGASYNFTMPSPVLCTIGPACTPGTYYTTINNPLTSAFSYGDLQVGVRGETEQGPFTFIGALAMGAASASGYVGWGSGASRTSPTPVSGSGTVISGEFAVGYTLSEAGRVALGYQFISFDVSGTAQFSPGGPTPWREWGSNQGATLTFVWSW